MKAALNRHTTEPLPVRWMLIGIAVVYMALFLLLPLILVFYQAFEKGFGEYWAVLCRQDTIRAIFMTLTTVAIAVPANVLFGLVAAWCIGKFQFCGKSFLISLIDLPFAVSPVIAGLLFVILFGLRSPLGSWLDSVGIRIVYSTTGAVLATMFVTFPFVARELIPIMQSQGTEEEQAARVLGANGLQIFFRVTLPNIKWALLYGIILCNARAMGEYGAVRVVCSGGKSNTLPILIEELYHGSNPVAPFAVSTLLALVAIITLILKTIIEKKTQEKENIERENYDRECLEQGLLEQGTQSQDDSSVADSCKSSVADCCKSRVAGSSTTVSDSGVAGSSTTVSDSGVTGSSTTVSGSDAPDVSEISSTTISSSSASSMESHEPHGGQP